MTERDRTEASRTYTHRVFDQRGGVGVIDTVDAKNTIDEVDNWLDVNGASLSAAITTVRLTTEQQQIALFDVINRKFNLNG